MLVDAGADTTSTVRVRNSIGQVILDHSPMACPVVSPDERNVLGGRATNERLRRLEAIRRLLLQVEPVHAGSWLFGSSSSSSSDVGSLGDAAAGKGTAERGRNAKAASTQQLAMMVPMMGRRARKRGVLRPALSRWVKFCLAVCLWCSGTSCVAGVAVYAGRVLPRWIFRVGYVTLESLQVLMPYFVLGSWARWFVWGSREPERHAPPP